MDKNSDDYLYTRDLGLIREIDGKTETANPIYAELIVRALNLGVQDSIKNTYREYDAPRYMKNGKLDMDFLIRDFQNYWRENSEIWTNAAQTQGGWLFSIAAWKNHGTKRFT